MHIKPLKWLASLVALSTAASLVRAADVIDIPAFGTNATVPAVDRSDAAPTEITLNVGDAAPKLTTGKWMQGEPVKEFAKGTAYIVEFWATWCGPCRESIPHLNEVYNKYKDKNLVVIGQDCWEDDEDQVAPFIKKMGDKMTYRVALDDKEGSKKGKMSDHWMDAAGQDGIPTSFLVDTHGVIAWIGHPMELKESVIEDVMADKFDVKKAVAEAAQRKENEAKLEKLSQQVSMALQDQDWDTAMGKLDQMAKLVPAEDAPKLDMLRFGLLLTRKDYPGAYKLAGDMSNTYKDNVRVLDALAWRMVADPSIEKRDLDLAEKIANLGNDAAKGKDASVFDTMARVRFLRGKKDEAVAMEQKALDVASDDEQKGDLQRSLDAYKKGELPKENTPDAAP